MERTSYETGHHRKGATDSAVHVTSAVGTPERRHRLHRLRLRRRFLPVLVAITLLSSLGIASVAFLATRADAISQAQARAAQDVRVERQLLASEGAGLAMYDGHLAVGTDNAVTSLNGDTSLVDRTSSLVNAHATIYEIEGPSLVAIATNVPKTNGSGHSISGSRALGDNLTGPAFDALLGRCGPTDSQGCHADYTGIVTLHGASYVASFTPLYDLTGAFVGAAGVAIPLDTVLAPSVQLSVLLLLVGLLLALAGTVAGFWAFGSISGKMFNSLDSRLSAVADAASALESLAQSQIERAQRQSRVAVQISEQARALDGLSSDLAEKHAALRESAGEIWAEMSQPGAMPEPSVALHWAQQAAVASGSVGEGVADARDRCRQLVTLMNHILADSTIAGQSGAEIEHHTHDLRASVEQVEVTLGERLVRWQSGVSPLIRRVKGGPRSFRNAITSRSLAKKGASPATSSGSHRHQGAMHRSSGAHHPSASGRRQGISANTGAMPAISASRWGEADTGQTGIHRASGPSNPGGSNAWNSPTSASSSSHPGARSAQDAGPMNLPGLPPELPSWRRQDRHEVSDSQWGRDDAR